MALARRSARALENGAGDQGQLERLVQSLAAGDEVALARFYNATSGLLFGLLLLILGDTSTAEAVLLEVCAEVKKHAARFDKNHESLLTWLITIAHRRALEHLCSSRTDQQFVVSVGLADPQGSGRAYRFGISKSAHRRLVGATLNALSPVELKMIELAYFFRLSPAAIAVRLRESPTTVETSLQSGISQLHKLFKNQGFLNAS